MLTFSLFVASIISCALSMPTPEEAIKGLNASTFLNAAQTLNEKKILGGDPDGPYTILVPVDSAFDKLSNTELQALTSDTQLLSEVLGVHVIRGELFSWDFRTGRILTSSNGHYIRVYQTTTGSTYLNDAKVLKWDIEANGAVIITIDTVLDAPEGTIYEILRKPDYGLSMLADLVDKVHYNNTLQQSPGPFTVFAPSQGAFDRLSPVILKELENNPTLLRHTIEYHVHPGTLHVKSLDRNGTVNTLYRNHNIGVTVSQTDVYLNSVATLEEADIDAENGVVHIIDHVLIPSTLGAIVG